MEIKKPRRVLFEYSAKSWIALGVFVVLLLLCLLKVLLHGFTWDALFLAIILIFFLLLIFSFEATVFQDGLELKYGLRPARQISTAEIESFYLKSNDGPIGRLFLPLEPLVIELATKAGQRYTLPVPEHKTLMDAMKSALHYHPTQ